MIWLGIALLAAVTLQRLIELLVSRANERRLRAMGGLEFAPGHYPILIAIHAAWFATLWWLAPGRPINFYFLALFALVELGRFWVLRTLGGRWTTRIIVVPDEMLVASGPYRFVNHPNYLVVAGEVAVLPLVFGLWQVALTFSLMNAAILAVRIRAEDQALGR
jgi:methyltransferase